MDLIVCNLLFQEKDGGVVKYGNNDVNDEGSVVVNNLPAGDINAPFNFLEVLHRQIAIIEERQRQEQESLGKAFFNLNAYFRNLGNMVGR